MDSSASEDETTHYESDSEDLLQEGEEAEAFDESLGESTENCMKTELELVRDIIENKLGSYLKYIYIKLMSSRIKRSYKHRYWDKLFKEELMTLMGKINEKSIILYLDSIIPPFNHEVLIDEIENKYKNKLKTYIQMRNDKVELEEVCNILIEREWDKLESEIQEKFICAYYALFFGNPLAH